MQFFELDDDEMLPHIKSKVYFCAYRLMLQKSKPLLYEKTFQEHYRETGKVRESHKAACRMINGYKELDLAANQFAEELARDVWVALEVDDLEDYDEETVTQIRNNIYDY